MTDTPSWDLYRSLLAVLRAGSLSGAARALQLTQPTISRHIDELETALGRGPLFTRAPQGLTPTETARSLEPHAVAMESAAAALERAASASSTEIAGTVRITASEVVGSEVLPSILRDLRVKHPGLAFEVLLSNQSADLLRRDADIAVRMVRPKQSALVAKKVGDIMLGFFAHPEYLAAHGKPKTMADLEGHALIGFDRDPGGSTALAGLPTPLRREMFSYRTDDQVAQLSALRAAFGIGICQVALAKREPKLVRLFAKEFEMPLETWVTMHQDLKSEPRIRAVFDHLAAALADYARHRS